MKIVVLGTNWVGDAIMSIPALRQIRASFPEASITLHTRSWAEGVFRDASFIDEIISYERTSSSFQDSRRQAKILRQRSFDTAFVFPNSFASAFTTWLARIPRRIGYSTDARGILLTDRLGIPAWKGKRHEVFYYLNLVLESGESVGGSAAPVELDPSTDLDVSDERRLKAREFLSGSVLASRKRTVALGVGSANSRAKRWPAENYAKLNDYLQVELNANVILVGAVNETDVAEEVYELAKHKPINLSGKTSLDTATALLSEVDMLISNDMGLAHIAPSVGTQTLVIFGPTDPETTRPFSPNATVIRKLVECSPCMLRDCPIDHRCMWRITTNEVFEHARMILTDRSEK
jgi:heptosyltransferase-2